MQRFRTIDGGVVPKGYRRAAGSPAEPVRCPTCNGSTLLPATVGMMTVDGRTVEGGTKQMICAQCLAEGRVTPVL